LASYLQTCLGRVERRSNIERRIGVPLTTAPRVVAPRTPMPGKRLAGALALMLVFMLGVLFLTQSLISRPSAPLAATTKQVSETSPNESDLPDGSNSPGEPAVAETESAGKTDASRTSSAPATVAAASSGPRGELISISPASETPAPANSEAQAEATPDERLATVGSAEPASEPPPPAAGPTAKDEPQVAYRSEAAPREESSPNEISPDVAAVPTTTQRNEPHAAAEIPTSSQLAESSTESEEKAMPTATPRKSLASSRTKSLRNRSKTRLAKDRSRSKHTVKRAQPLPKLRVGSAPAEYVGTTKGGDWILSVDTTGETIVVPPPPGYTP
jgi:hypothetical protein